MSLIDLDKHSVNRSADLARAEVRISVQSILEKEEIVFIVGSGVSCFLPSNLPRGGAVVNILADHLSRDTEPRNFVENQIKNSAFETIFQSCPDELAIQSLFSDLFSPKIPNDIHKKITEICNDRKFDVITTNYDNLFEASGAFWSRIINQSDYNIRQNNRRLYKIHGTIEQKDSLIFTISAESPLRDWKLNLFNEMVNGKIVIVIGYSGLDFEICPALLASRAAAILWNVYGNFFPSPNCEHIFSRDNRMRIIKGDMCELLSVQAQIGTDDGRQIIDNFFSSLPKNVFLSWQLKLLDNIGLPKQADQILKKNVKDIVRIDGERVRVGISYRRGHYLWSAWHAAWSARHRKGRANRIFAACVDSAFRTRNFGSQWLTVLLRKIADWQYQYIDNNTKNEFESAYPWLKYLMALDNKVDERKLIHLAEVVAKKSLDRGEWGLFYLVEPALTKAGIDIGAAVGINAPLLPARLGFAHIGNLSSFIDDFTADMNVQNYSKADVRIRIEYAKIAQLHPNRWKICLAAMKCTPNGDFKFKIFLAKNFLAALMHCQYTSVHKAKIITRGAKYFLRIF